MSNFPTEKTHSTWSVFRERDNKYLGEWRRDPKLGQKIKPKECLFSRTIVRLDRIAGRVYVK